MKMSKSSNDLISTGEAARMLGATRQHVVDLCSRGVLPYVLIGTHRRVKRDDVTALAARPSADRGGPMTRDQIRALWLHRVAAAHVARAPGRSLVAARRRLRMLLAKDPSGRPWLEDWQALLWEGPETVMREMVSTAPHARELRQNSPWLGLLTARERSSTLKAFEDTYPSTKNDS
jgi:excisionase family DNA binding protein